MVINVIDVIFLVLAYIAVPIEAYAQCGMVDCYGWTSYCCGVLNDECCDYSVYQFWWFWLIWLSFFILIVSCSCWCYRRRQYRAQYVTIRQDYPPSYGTVVVSAPPAYPAQQHQIGATAPQPPPYNQEKPPAYIP
ncbi:WW domain binding protein 1-like [Patella vulgata]|uniref:WW domain binding protein 1-like n=1 Tax=Patella vulgata TaxID=6465 RepID=UPI00217F7442|nr:WW domain binding protein 1-like [Patella vulgata]